MCTWTRLPCTRLLSEERSKLDHSTSDNAGLSVAALQHHTMMTFRLSREALSFTASLVMCMVAAQALTTKQDFDLYLKLCADTWAKSLGTSNGRVLDIDGNGWSKNEPYRLGWGPFVTYTSSVGAPKWGPPTTVTERLPTYESTPSP
jgi:hypothetical protein